MKLLESCRMRATPIVTVINTLDGEGRDTIELLDEVEEVLGIECAPITCPIGMGRRLRGIYHLIRDEIHLYESGRNYMRQAPTVVSGLNSKEADEALGADAQELRDEIELVKGASHDFDAQLYLAGKQSPVFFGSALNKIGRASWRGRV